MEFWTDELLTSQLVPFGLEWGEGGAFLAWKTRVGKEVGKRGRLKEWLEVLSSVPLRTACLPAGLP